MKVRIVAAVGAASMLSGCVAPLLAGVAMGGGEFLGVKSYTNHYMSTSERKEASAEAVGGDLNPRKIDISDVKKGSETESWTAKTPIGRYSCSIPTGRQHATCVKSDG